VRRPVRRQLLRPLPLRDYLFVNTTVAVLAEVVQAALLAGLAASRANGHRLTATEAAVFLAVAAVFAVGFGSLITFYSGVAETLAGLVITNGRRPRPAAGDPFAPRSVWGRYAVSAVVAAAWGTGLGVLVVAVLNGRQAGYAVMFAGLLVAAGAASVVNGLLMRTTGVGVALERPKAAVRRPVRRRAWREIALPLAIFVAAVNGTLTWVLFHDYAVGVDFGSRVLTEQQVLADVFLLVILNALVAAWFCGRAGRAEAAMKLVAFDDPGTELPEGKGGFGVQAFVGSVIAMLLVTSLVRFLLPPLPNLAEAIAARAFLAAGTALVVGGLAYVRGAANVTTGATTVVPRYTPAA
jgi:hypothetical protein